MARIRLAAPDDLAAVRRCVDAAFTPYVARIGKPPAPMLQDYAALIGKGRVHILAGPKGLIGVLVIEPHPDHLFIDTIAIDPAHHGQGLGRTLMCHGEDEARRRSLSEIRLYTHERMTETLPFDSAVGFVETGRRVEDNYARVYLRKALP
jgi:ribosomal protein S18 acetylase RimI-like enzyme